MDIFTATRFKIAFLYVLMGFVILAFGAYLLSLHISIEIVVAILIVITMVVAYILAAVTLKPIERAVAQQKRFMANISHELRTPLSVMKTDSEVALLEAADFSGEKMIETLKGNLEEVNRMAKIIEFLLVFSSLENRLSKLKFVPVDLREIAEKAVILMKTAANEKDIDLALTADEGAIVRGDATAIEEMIVNLLKNAASYTPPWGSVKIAIVKKDREVTLSVEDTGVGIPEKDIQNIFEPFYRGNNASGQKKDINTGLGLAIVKEIAAIHKAHIHVESKVGRGTRISVRFHKNFIVPTVRLSYKRSPEKLKSFL